MKLKYQFAVSTVAGKSVAVAVGEDLEKFNGFVKMNETGAFIFGLLKNEVSKEEIISALKAEYSGASDEEIASSVDAFLETLNKKGIIE